MQTKVLIAAALMLAVSFAMVIPADDSDAAVGDFSLEEGTKISIERGDTITLHVRYTSDFPTTLRVVITDKSQPQADPVFRENMEFKAGGGTLEITYNYDKGDSPVYMKIAFIQGSLAVGHIDYEVNYTSSIWSNPALYVAIIIVVVLIIIFVVYKSRTAPKKDKNTLTFEQIEAERQAQRSSAAPKKEAPSATKSERQKYLASKRKKE